MKKILALLWILSMATWPAVAAEFQAKMEVVDLGVLDTGRPAKVSLW